MFASRICMICNETGHRVGKCPDLWANKTPEPQKGGDDHDEEKFTISGNTFAHVFNQIKGSNAGHWKPRSVINM